MNWLRNFMVGRYGVDQMNVGLLLFSMLCTLISSFSRGYLFFLSLIGMLVLLYAVFRMFSRNTSARAKENEAFLKFWNSVKPVFYKIKAWFQRLVNRVKGSKTHCYFSCPKCQKKLRVPRGKGKIEICCPICGTKFIKKT